MAWSWGKNRVPAGDAKSATTPVVPVQSVDAQGNVIGGGELVVVNATGAAAIAATTASTKRFKLRSVTCHLDAAPTTSEAFTVTVDALGGAAYDTVLRSVDLSLVPTTDFYFEPQGEAFYEAGDQIVVAYPNTDTGTYGLRIVIEEF